MIPEKSQGKVLQATVVAVGPGTTTKVFIIIQVFLLSLILCWEIKKKVSHILFLCQNGAVTPVSVKVGEKVLLPEYGGTKVVLEDKVHGFMYCGTFLL